MKQAGAVVLGLAGLLAAVAAAHPVVSQERPVMDDASVSARSDYIEHCGGCHGIKGSSSPARVPILRDRVGYFMCLPEARDYLVRLPNVAHARIEDPAELANLVNYVVFSIGGRSVRSDTRPFTPGEVERLRRTPLQNVSLVAERRRLVENLIAQCGAPVALRVPF